jgi:hypothetical protein
VVDLVARLEAAGPHFRAGWAGHDVDRFSSGERRFEHPEVGTLLIVHTAADGSGTAARLLRMTA